MDSNRSKLIVISLITILIAVYVIVFVIDRKNDKLQETENALKNLNATNVVSEISAEEIKTTLEKLSAPNDKSLLSEEDETRALKLLQN